MYIKSYCIGSHYNSTHTTSYLVTQPFYVKKTHETMKWTNLSSDFAYTVYKILTETMVIILLIHSTEVLSPAKD